MRKIVTAVILGIGCLALPTPGLAQHSVPHIEPYHPPSSVPMPRVEPLPRTVPAPPPHIPAPENPAHPNSPAEPDETPGEQSSCTEQQGQSGECRVERLPRCPGDPRCPHGGTPG